jgi:hypothetical protein
MAFEVKDGKRKKIICFSFKFQDEKKNGFKIIPTWAQCYKSFYRSNLLPLHAHTAILCYKATLSSVITVEWLYITMSFV